MAIRTYLHQASRILPLPAWGPTIAASAAETRQYVDATVTASAAETRRHFGVVGEGLHSKIQLVAEGVVALDQKVDRFPNFL